VYHSGTTLAGISAGAACWFEGCMTDSFGSLSVLNDGLGLLPGSFCPHYNTELDRPKRFIHAIQSGALPQGVALDDGVAARYCNESLDKIYRCNKGVNLHKQGEM
jgi:putative peptidase family S51 protein